MHNQAWGGDKPVRLEATYMDNPGSPIQCKEFMQEGQRQWDTRKVLQVFTAADASKILQRPIANSRGDVLRWSHHLSGIYSTKSVHHWLAHREREYTDDSPKLYLLEETTRACLGSGICKLCETETENVLHAVRECPATQEVISFSGLGHMLPWGPYMSCKNWLEDVLQVLDCNQFRFLLVILWNIWNRRNRWVHENQLIPAKMVSDYAQLIAAESQEAWESPYPLQQTRAAVRWEKPELDSIKVNVDGAWSQEQNLAAVAIVARDHNGMLGPFRGSLVP
ncbi:hypothetical protein V6N11_056278 [Hibiscus sabdariffa]|uniref:RNase H type-1 domain-containing protein n=1 Tax=Hibiscus sabdariffa TaxID=183260 RepID=A0ABR2T3D9_9ROSI